MDWEFRKLFSDSYEEYLIEMVERTHSEYLDDELDKLNGLD